MLHTVFVYYVYITWIYKYICIDRALNILISYNNKPANKAIPVYQELVIPLSEQFVTNNNFRNLKSLLQTTRSNFEFLFKEISQSQFTPLFVQNEMYPLYMQSVEFADQFVPLLETIGAGKYSLIYGVFVCLYIALLCYSDILSWVSL